ncbi:beta-barrel assembly-enhancing protease [Geobacter sp. OR-1]|uniref:M48 family metalloprotease n=1 Tax=Geobacter sp. OR-1 TaxID=1266765 RepID=UPI0005443371|nr:M48 family metalloprotease [Geobacter sp. OR-1]GAM09840.1 beta-barrel assembly-enhancing protease [Geobacter sp. OR-1]
MRQIVSAALIMSFLWSGTAMAGLFDELQKFVDPNTKEGKILSGATQVLSSAKEIDYPTERTIGESLALEGLQRFGRPMANENLQQYVNLVGDAVAANSKRATIPYEFAVLDSPVQNAFAAPAGIIFVSKALIGIMDSEAELAGVLAHEVGHVAGKHAIGTIRRSQFLQGVGSITAATMKGNKGKQFESMIGDLQTVLFDKGLDKELEFEADAAAMETAYRTGYDPRGLITVLKKLQKIEALSANKKGSWFSTHPPLGERIERLEAQLRNYPDAPSLARLAERFAKRVKQH